MLIRPTIVLDLDGTLIDTAQRHYRVYASVSERFNVKMLDFQDYWDLRRSGLSNDQVLKRAGLSDHERRQTDAIWRRDIESVPLLDSDRVLPGVEPWLDAWRNVVDFILVTVRTNAEAVREQVGRLHLLQHFTDVIVIPHGSGPENIKAKAAREQLRYRPVAWVGDTELDIQAANEMGAWPIGVTSGIRTAALLRRAGAKEIVDSVTAIQAWPTGPTGPMDGPPLRCSESPITILEIT